MLRFLTRLARTRRTLCTSSAPTGARGPESDLFRRVEFMHEELLESDWVDTDESKPVDLLVEKADNLIDEYRRGYTSETPQDATYDAVSKLYFLKETVSIVEAYANLAEQRMRKHEGMLGFFGDNTVVPEGEGEETIELFRDYVAFMNKQADEEIKTKVELELGRKMIHLKMFVSMENFSVEIAPIAGDRMLPSTPKQKSLPKEETSHPLPSRSDAS